MKLLLFLTALLTSASAFAKFECLFINNHDAASTIFKDVTQGHPNRDEEEASLHLKATYEDLVIEVTYLPFQDYYFTVSSVKGSKWNNVVYDQDLLMSSFPSEKRSIRVKCQKMSFEYK